MEKHKLSWRSFVDAGPAGRGTIATKWNQTATPTFYVIDHRGVIRHKWVGSPSTMALDAALEELIEEVK